MAILLSYSIPYMEIKRNKGPVDLLISAGYITAYKLTPRGNHFVVNNKKVRGIYNINNKYRYMLENTPIYWHSVQESNVIDPVMIDKVNKFMRNNGLVSLTLKDVKQGVRLRLLIKRYNSLNKDEREKETTPLEQLVSEEEARKQIINTGLESAKKVLEESKAKLDQDLQRDVPLSDFKKCNLVLDHLKEQGILEGDEYANYLQKVDKSELNFTSLIDDLKVYHLVGITEPLDEETEKFLHDLAKQHPQEWAGVSKDLRDTKRGLREMLSRPISSTISWYLMIPCSALTGLIKDLEIHYSWPTTPIAIILDKRRIVIKKIISKGQYFVINDKKLGGVYEKSLESQYMWGKTPCYIYHLPEKTLLKFDTVKQYLKYCLKRSLVTIKKQTKQKLVLKQNTLIDHLKSLGQIDDTTHKELENRILNDRIDFDTLIETLERKQKLSINRALNVEVDGFIEELGAINAQEWAGHTQDLRTNFKGLKDMTATPVKSFLSAGVILAGGIVIVMAIAVLGTNGGAGIMKSLGGAGKGGLSIPFLGGHLILGSNSIMTWLSLHTPWLVEWLI